MTPLEYPLLHQQLVQLADALGGKPPTQAGMTLWVQTLKEFLFPDVVGAIDAWAKRATKMPAPADIWKPCNELRSERIEQTAKQERREFRLEADQSFRRNDEFGRKLRALASGLRERPEVEPLDWARVIVHRFLNDLPGNHGGPINPVQIASACDALRLDVKSQYAELDDFRASLSA